MKEDLTYNRLIANLQDPSDPLFGGSLAYIEIEESLSMLIKLLKIKLKKPSEMDGAYQKIILIAETVMKSSDEMITKDGENFSLLRKAPTQEEKDKTVKAIYAPSLAFLHNINMLSGFTKDLSSKTTTSIKYDFDMISSTLDACFENLTHILLYEISKMSQGAERDGYELAVEKLAMSKKAEAIE
jgi:hypothetical protein